MAAARNPLNVALAAMAAHTAAALACGWPFPSVATFLAGMFAVAWLVFATRPPPTAIGTLLGLAVFTPALVPPSVLAAGVSALLAGLLPHESDPLRSVAIALPSLTILVLALTF